MRLILASASPRRAELLRQAGYEFEVLAAGIDERVRSGEQPDDHVRRLAREKSAAVLASIAADGERNDTLVLAADTVVVVDGEILGKPHDDRHAAEMLRKLAGRAHEVLTGVSLRRGAVEAGQVARTTVWVNRLAADELDWYVSSGEGRDKAGAYAIQGLASRFIPRIDGSYTNVVGLPLAAVHELIRHASGDGRSRLASRPQ
jgi:septum formation protein